MICNGWYVNDTFIPLADSRQGQPNGVATLKSNGTELAQETEEPVLFADTLPWSADSEFSTAQYLFRLMTGFPVD